MCTTCVESCARSSCGAVSEAGRAGGGNEARVTVAAGEGRGGGGVASLCAAVGSGVATRRASRATSASTVTNARRCGGGARPRSPSVCACVSVCVCRLLRASASDMADWALRRCAVLLCWSAPLHLADGAMDVRCVQSGRVAEPGTVGLAGAGCGCGTDRHKQHTQIRVRSGAHTFALSHSTNQPAEQQCTRCNLTRSLENHGKASKLGIQHGRTQSVCYDRAISVQTLAPGSRDDDELNGPLRVMDPRACTRSLEPNQYQSDK